MINLNSAFEEELYFKFLRDPDSVSSEWQQYFNKINNKTVFPIDTDFINGNKVQDKNKIQGTTVVNRQKSENSFSEQKTTYISEQLKDYEYLEELDISQDEFATKLSAAQAIPTATAMRTIPVKALEENRRIINRYMLKLRKRRVSFTHLLAWATVKALIKYPHLNDRFLEINGKGFRVRRKNLNVGLAVDIVKDDGVRLLLIPSIKNAQKMDFKEFFEEFNFLIEKTRSNQLTHEDLLDTTVTLTNPGMIGTSYSIPRIIEGQGVIIATGTIDYPVEFQAVRPDALTNLAISKVVTLTNTYDHRIIHGAESAEFLAYLHKLLIGGDRFYEQIFFSLDIPFEPVRWSIDNSREPFLGYDKKSIIEKGAHVMRMINAYRVRGHLLANINPLGFDSYYYPELDPAYYGFTIWDLDREFHADDSWENNNLPLRDIIEILRETYCGRLGIEFMHIQSPEKKDWIKYRLERTRSSVSYDKEEKIHTFKKLIEAESFENFLHTKFVGSKRFSLEGAEAVIALIDKIFEYSAYNDLNAIVLGMAHRGRLNVLANLVSKSYARIFNEFDGDIDPNYYHGSGDVKYHLGSEGYYKSRHEKEVKVILSPNPSHLELVDPVVLGMTRALDNEIGDKNYKQNLSVLVHGDAAFAGQGIVSEILNLTQLEGYKNGGTIHIIINNQIGFTTTTDSARSTIYATDIAKMIQVPILHVNGNDPEVVRAAAEFACEYRNKFGSDVIIDMLCYRKYGHNEADEPSYTQPLLYKKIKSMTHITKLYEAQLLDEKMITFEEAEDLYSAAKAYLNEEFNNRKNKKPSKSNNFKIEKKELLLSALDSTVDVNTLEKIANAITKVPPNFNLHNKVGILLRKRMEMFQSNEAKIDWALAETLALGSILTMGKDVRFTGQDTRRGTFSQRHAVIYDIRHETPYIPLNGISEEQGKLRIFDSPLSEVACMGFEYGYSVIASEHLTIWEAQFGDFANNAQSIIDQFIACAESKWGQTSNLVLLLPHGYEGQGPEHSSARLERYLQLCADDNMLVAYLSTPAQYFHLLIRQVLHKHKVPLILMTPKSLLRHPLVISSVDDLTNGRFYNIIDDVVEPENVEKVIFTQGKIYWELFQKRNELEQNKNVALVRIELLYPFDDEAISTILKKYSNANKYCWVQEEPKNMGAWSYLMPLLSDLLPQNKRLEYIGRKASSSTATGSYKKHIHEQEQVLVSAFE